MSRTFFTVDNTDGYTAEQLAVAETWLRDQLQTVDIDLDTADMTDGCVKSTVDFYAERALIRAEMDEGSAKNER